MNGLTGIRVVDFSDQIAGPYCAKLFVDAGAEVIKSESPEGDSLRASSDAILENFTPRVLEGFGLGWERVRTLNPHAILMRMPAFGLSGPWRDRTGFAQTMEQLSGLAWLTGHSADQPRIPRGPCDPIAGMHAAFACLVALVARAGVGARASRREHDAGKRAQRCGGAASRVECLRQPDAA